MSRRRILFVDDNPEFLGSVRELMLSYSEGTWEVLLAQGAGPALAFLQQQAVDLIVVDIEMPVVDGLQLLQLLRRKYPRNWTRPDWKRSSGSSRTAATHRDPDCPSGGSAGASPYRARHFETAAERGPG